MESSKGPGSARIQGNPLNQSVPDLVQQRAVLTPDALAVHAGAEQIAYRELDLRSNRLANYLGGLGVVPGNIVGLCVDRTIDFPIAALAILKAGCAYLPLDPKAPSRRLQTMLSSAQVPVVLTHSAYTASLAGGEKKVVALDDSAAEISRSSSDKLSTSASPDQLAYVIYTSGSTGTPKAVAVGHDSLLNLVRWHNRAFGVIAADRATQVASIGFDAAVWELWPYFVAGASVHLVDDETRTHPEQLRDWLVQEKITVSFAPTPLVEHMLQLPWPKETALRFLLTGADTLHNYPSENLPFTLVNNYGPTECTVVATSGAVTPRKYASTLKAEDKLPSIGRAIDNAEIYILNDKMARVSAGEIGEIYVGGALLAKGYLNDPTLTAERFVSNPFASGTRLYRTGDLGCLLPDGQIAFRGRADEQVKINGYRIELNEVAGVLLRHPAIRESAIGMRESDTGEKQMVGYIVPRSVAPTVGELREFLANELPEYMLPAVFVSLDSLPTKSSGKVDRAALPAPNEQNVLRDEAFLGPRTPTEQRIAEIVSRLLGLQQVGMNDNFFYLGGNSLFGTQVIARLRDAFGVEVPLLKLFDHPTVADLSAEVERMIMAKVDSISEEEAQRLLALHTEQANT
jgi:amino acid adenylation domain-containing protein